ncbi:hypothetical protein ACWDZ8_11195 [Streptomyces sp. NPDC003233]
MTRDEGSAKLCPAEKSRLIVSDMTRFKRGAISASVGSHQKEFVAPCHRQTGRVSADEIARADTD